MMKRQFSLAHLTMIGCTPPEMIEVAAATGYSHVSLRLVPVTPNEPKYPLHEDKVMMRETKARMADTGVKLLDIELCRIQPATDVSTYLPALEAAAELGGKHVISGGWDPNRKSVIERMARLCDMAKPLGLTIDVEFVTFTDTPDMKAAVEVISAVNKPNLGLLIDTLHFHRSRCKLEEIDAVPKSWFHFVQACDADGEIPTTREGLIFTARADRKFLGEGGIDVAAILNRMPLVPYSLEIPNAKLALSLSPIEFARRAIDTANRYLDAHPRG